MIKGRSALDSLLEFGLANDGPLNKGGLGVNKPEEVNKDTGAVDDVNKSDVNKRKEYMRNYMAKKRGKA